MDRNDKVKSMNALKDAWFFVAVFGRGQTSKLVKGWDNLCDEATKSFYGSNATPAMRATVINQLANWDDWVFDFSGLPFNKILQSDTNGGFEVFRVAEGYKELDALVKK